MTEIVPIRDSEDVMVSVGCNLYMRGRRVEIRVISAPTDEDLPKDIAQALVGMNLPTVFGHGQHPSVPTQGRAGPANEIVERLIGEGKGDVAADLLKVIEEVDPDHPVFILFNEASFEANVAPTKKLRNATSADFAVIKERLTNIATADYVQERNKIAAELGLTHSQVGTIRMHVLNGSQPKR
jgi:hypothetical protein